MKMENDLARWNRALTALRDEADRHLGRYPDDRLELFTAAEPCDVPEHRHGELSSAIRKAFVSLGEPDEDLDGFWVIDGGRFALRYLGDRPGRDEFMRLVDQVWSMLASHAEWKPACSVGLPALICYLGLWRPMPLLRTQLECLPLRTDSPFGVSLPDRDGKWLRAIRLTLTQSVFLAARSAIEWIIAPTESMRSPSTLKYPTKLLPEWEAIRGLFEEIEAGSDGAAVPTAHEATRECCDDLIVDDFCVERRGKRCVLGETISFRLIAFLSQRDGKCVPLADIAEKVWGDDLMGTDGMKKLARECNRKLASAGIEGVAVDTTTRGVMRLLVN